MSVGPDSRWNLCPLMVTVDASGQPVEHEHISLPYDRALVVSAVKSVNVYEYIVHEGDTWASIAASYYRGRSDLWWIIAEWSDIVDPMTELVVGRNLNIPSLNVVMFDVLKFDEDKKGRPSDRGV